MSYINTHYDELTVVFWIITTPIIMYALYRWYGLTFYLGIKVIIKDILQRRKNRIIRLQQRLKGEAE